MNVLNKAETLNHIADALSVKEVVKTVQTGTERLAILKGITLNIKPGESVAIVGASGSGKSTLLGILAGLDAASQGEVWLLGKELGALNEDERAQVRAQGVSFVFQNFQLLPGLTALENVMLPLEIQGSKKAKQEATELLGQVGLAARLSHYPNQLSGGEQQRVAIARAFAGKPKILFADEPTGNLDSHTGAQIEELLFSLNKNAGTTLVLVTHDTNLAKRCDKQIRIHDGRVA